MSLPPYLDSDHKLSRSRKQEKKIAKAYGGKKIKGSGNGKFQKGDVRAGRFLIEAKRTDAASIVLKREWLAKIEQEAFDDGKYPALEIQIQNQDWVLIRRAEFQSLKESFGGK